MEPKLLSYTLYIRLHADGYCLLTFEGTNPLKTHFKTRSPILPLQIAHIDVHIVVSQLPN